MRNCSCCNRLTVGLAAILTVALISAPAPVQAQKKSAKKAELEYPPRLPGKDQFVTLKSPELLKSPETIHSDVAIAKAVPTVEITYLPGQDYPGKPWSIWGDSLCANGKYYCAIGDHFGPYGDAFVYEYDPEAKSFRELCSVAKTLNMPEGHYVPGKIHSRLDMGKDGRIYFSTHRGSTRVTTDQYHYKGDWILASDPRTGKTEIVAHGPVPKHCLPTGTLDPQRMIFYGGTSPGELGVKDIRFFAYDVANGKLLYSGPDGPSRYIMLADSTGMVYYTPGTDGKTLGPLVRFDPANPGPPQKLNVQLGLRTCTQETPEGKIFTISHGGRGEDSLVYEFDTKTEQVRELGSAVVGTQNYITSVDADPTGRYLYYTPGAHGGSEKDGSPLVQFDTKTGKKKILAFLHPLCQEKFGCTLKGTFGSAIDEKGERVYITWNNSRGGRVWDSCLLSVIHIPASER